MIISIARGSRVVRWSSDTTRALFRHHHNVVTADEELLGVQLLRELPIAAQVRHREERLHCTNSSVAHVLKHSRVRGMRDAGLGHVHQDEVHVLVERLEVPGARASNAVHTANDDDHALALEEAPPKHGKRAICVCI